MDLSNSIQLRNISKRFGKYSALDDINLEVPAGVIYGISGKNGAGKSVLLRIICGFIKPSAGEVFVMGRQIGKDIDFPPSTGALIDAPGFLADYSARKNLTLLSRISQMAEKSRIDEVLEIVGLDPKDDRPLRCYSNGMRKRLGIAQAILERPRVLLLDEPTDAIDQAGWKDVYEYLIATRDQDCAILFSSNNLDEITILCDKAFILENGRLREAD